ncbi:uncharacterized protein BXZ73DRAFT_55456 [Epithele typhae]|uniref:uncharacterized protein n=1 Tax=Epithele typhae TaxID=378194 RepID=UPI002008889C|nr:uncharacterized protein BXZ73DRAFT_55456 [Epithele typhae]KAH9913579.1 hypothetical protein BXZ73DRAFT_55456 [Epithele typhae]
MESRPPDTQVAAPPFDQPSADIIVRSTDRVDFLVHRTILAQASPVFADMFTLPQQPRGSADTEPPVVEVSEDKETLRHLLLFCYPVKKPALTSFEDIVPVLSAAVKYDMGWLVDLLSAYLKPMMSARPLRVWAIACGARLEELAQEAAEQIKANRTVSKRFMQTMCRLVKEEGLDVLNNISGGEYFRLFEHWRCRGSFTLYPAVPPAPSSTYPFPVDNCVEFVPADPPPDILLRCTDNKVVKAHRLILLLHMAKVTLTGPPCEDPDSLPLSSIDMSSTQLVPLLRVCYRGELALPSGPEAIAGMLSDCRRLQMDGMLPMLARRWKETVEAAPFEAYFAAADRFDPCDAAAAARETIKHKLDGVYTPNMENASAAACHHLLEFYRDTYELALYRDEVSRKKLEDDVRRITDKLTLKQVWRRPLDEVSGYFGAA